MNSEDFRNGYCPFCGKIVVYLSENYKLWMKKMKNYLYIAFYAAYLTIFYKVFYLNSHKGWFVRKRPITMLIISPLLIPFFMLYGIIIYYDRATNWYYRWIGDDNKKKLTFRDKLSIKHRLK